MLIRPTQWSEEGEVRLIRTVQSSGGGEHRLFGRLLPSDGAKLWLIRTTQLFVGGLVCSEEGAHPPKWRLLRPKEPLLSTDGALLRPNEEELWLEEPARSSDGRLLSSEEPEQPPAGGRYCTHVN